MMRRPGADAGSYRGAGWAGKGRCEAHGRRPSPLMVAGGSAVQPRAMKRAAPRLRCGPLARDGFTIPVSRCEGSRTILRASVYRHIDTVHTVPDAAGAGLELQFFQCRVQQEASVRGRDRAGRHRDD